MDEQMQQLSKQNKAIRGYIIRSLVKGFQNALLVRQISNALVAEGLIVSPDISKHLAYLEDSGYIRYTDKKVNSYTAYMRDAVVQLTRKGIDLVEGTLEDAGVDV